MRFHSYHLASRVLIEIASLWIVATIFSNWSHGQELETPQAAEVTAAQQSIRSDWMTSNGVNRSTEPNATWEDALGGTLPLGPFSAHLNGEASLIYNDNVYLDSIHPTSDLIWTITPRVMVGTGDYIWKKDSWFTVDYAPSLILFTDHGSNNTVDENGNLNMEWKPANWTFGLKQEYRRLSGPVVEAAGRLDRNIYDTAASIKYDLDTKMSFDLEADQSVNDYESPAVSFTQWTLVGWVNYWITPKVKVSLGANAGFLNIDENPGQRYQQGLLHAQYDMTESVKLRATIGAELREFESGRSDRINGIFAVGATFQPMDNCTILLDGYRRDENSLVETEQNYTITGGSATLSEAIGENLTLNATTGFNHSDYYGTSPGVSGAGSYNYWFVRPGVDYKLTSQLTLGLFYQYQESDSTLGRQFENNITGINLVYHF